jgi:hypothetical protein
VLLVSGRRTICTARQDAIPRTTAYIDLVDSNSNRIKKLS